MLYFRHRLPVLTGALAMAALGGCSSAQVGYRINPRIAQISAISSLSETEPGASTSGCDLPTAEKGLMAKQISVWGYNRTYLLSVPSGYQPKVPHRLIFGWHGYGLSGQQMHSFVSPIEELAGADAIFVYPDTAINGGTRGLDGRSGGPDVAFFDALVASISSSYCIDAHRVFAIGFSDGAFFTNALAQSRSQALRGIIPIAGGGGGGPNMAVMVIHSKDDGTVGIGNGLGSVSQWAGSNSCHSEDYGNFPLGTCRALTGCKEGFPVTFCRWGRTQPNQGTHDWPRFPSANSDIWQFFAKL